MKNQVYRNSNFTKRNYECTNIIACIAEKAPSPHWVPIADAYLQNLVARGAQQLHILDDVTYYGWL